MNYWIVTHNRHEPEDEPWYVYLKDSDLQRRHPGKDDRVLFYETVKPFPGRTEKGRGAIVWAAVVSGAVEPRTPPAGPFTHQMACDGHRRNKEPKYKVVHGIVPKFVNPKGCLLIDEDQYRQICRAMEI